MSARYQAPAATRRFGARPDARHRWLEDSGSNVGPSQIQDMLQGKAISETANRSDSRMRKEVSSISPRHVLEKMLLRKGSGAALSRLRHLEPRWKEVRIPDGFSVPLPCFLKLPLFPHRCKYWLLNLEFAANFDFCMSIAPHAASSERNHLLAQRNSGVRVSDTRFCFQLQGLGSVASRYPQQRPFPNIRPSTTRCEALQLQSTRCSGTLNLKP